MPWPFSINRPLFPGHVLLIPPQHVDTLADLPRRPGRPAVSGSAEAGARRRSAPWRPKGTFIAVNNRVSQSVPHLHVHIVPRRKGDGLKGFFWPRRGYDSDEHLRETAEKIRQAM